MNAENTGKILAIQAAQWEETDMERTIAVITGASSGLGKEFAKLLVRRKDIDEVWAIARRKDKLTELKQELGEKIIPFSVDLSDAGQIVSWQRVLEEQSPEIRYLINDAGFAKFCSYMDLSIEESLNMIHVNCDAVVAMTLSCLPYMNAKSKILNISSQASFQPLPYLNLYSATKAFIRHYSRALNVELEERGIQVTAVCPGWMLTHLYGRATVGAKKGTHKFYGMKKPAPVARKALKDADLYKNMSVYSLYVKGSHLAAKLLPHRLVMKLWLYQQKL